MKIEAFVVVNEDDFVDSVFVYAYQAYGYKDILKQDGYTYEGSKKVWKRRFGIEKQFTPVVAQDVRQLVTIEFNHLRELDDAAEFLDKTETTLEMLEMFC